MLLTAVGLVALLVLVRRPEPDDPSAPWYDAAALGPDGDRLVDRWVERRAAVPLDPDGDTGDDPSGDVTVGGDEDAKVEAGDDSGKDATSSRGSTDRGHGAVQADGAAKGALLWGNLLVAGGTLPFFAFSIGGMAWSDAAVLLYLGSAQVALAYRCLVSGVRRVPALEASLLILFEPVLNPLWAWLLLGEVPGGWSLGGAAIIAAVTAVRAFAGDRREA